jgi:hypothetical protein
MQEFSSVTGYLLSIPVMTVIGEDTFCYHDVVMIPAIDRSNHIRNGDRIWEFFILTLTKKKYRQVISKNVQYVNTLIF